MAKKSLAAFIEENKPHPAQDPRRLFLDIETSPNIGVFWRPGTKLTLTPENITKEREIICASWKWGGAGNIHSATWSAAQSDEALVARLATILNKASEVVAHNGDHFDIRWIRGRCLKYGFTVNPFLASVDTYKIARRYFELNSHRLDYIGRYLGLGGKRENGGLDMWKRVTLENDRDALAEMVKYNRRDVQLLEDVYYKLHQYFPSKLRSSGVADTCPACGSEKMFVVKRRMTAAGRKTVQLCCANCGKYHQIPASKLHKPRVEKW
jgi:DNA polymerase elongation subunit (family B)